MGAHNRYIRMPWGKSDANTNITIVTNFTNPNMIPKKAANVNPITNIQILMGAHKRYIPLPLVNLMQILMQIQIQVQILFQINMQMQIQIKPSIIMRIVRTQLLYPSSSGQFDANTNTNTKINISRASPVINTVEW